MFQKELRQAELNINYAVLKLEDAYKILEIYIKSMSQQDITVLSIIQLLRVDFLKKETIS